MSYKKYIGAPGKVYSISIHGCKVDFCSSNGSRDISISIGSTQNKIGEKVGKLGTFSVHRIKNFFQIEAEWLFCFLDISLIFGATKSLWGSNESQKSGESHDGLDFSI